MRHEILYQPSYSLLKVQLSSGESLQAEAGAILAAQKLVDSFRGFTNSVDCFDITGLDESSSILQMIIHFLIKGGTIYCFGLTGKYARAAFEDASLRTNPRMPLVGELVQLLEAAWEGR